MSDARAQNRYRVLERLESGGMAEVFRGESESVAGFKKQVAIKRVLPHLASNERFIRMFLDEARLSARLSHANIVQVFDIGHVENTYFIVMEFIDGVNLKALVEFLRAKKTPVPVPIACHITMKICEGLFYAHEATGDDGSLLKIVHRDISPPNVLLSRRGEIKIVDFGLAKAAHSVEKTEPGIVKGKFSYLAPETAMGQEADPQADIFACGIMLWEMLAGRKLFQGDTDFQTVKAVQQAVVPNIRTINPNVPEELDKILKQALARDKANRYATAQALGEDLSNFLFAHKLKVSSSDISKLVTEVMAERTAAKTATRTGDSVIDQLIQEELLRFTSLGEPSSPSPDGRPSVPESSLGDGAQPLDPGQFVDPSDWARSTLGDTFDPGALGSSMGWDEPGAAGPTSSPGNLAEELEGESIPAPPMTHPPSSPRPAPVVPLTSSILAASGLPIHAPPPRSDAHENEPSAGARPITLGPNPSTRYTNFSPPPPPKEFPGRVFVISVAVAVAFVGVGVALLHMLAH